MESPTAGRYDYVPRAAGGNHMRRFAIVLSALLLHGCDLFPISVCTDQLVYGIQVTVRDSMTGELLSVDPTGVLTDGPYRETMEAVGPSSLWGAPERPGTYDIEITAQGYWAWSRQGVEVEMERDGCHVKTVKLEAGMVLLAAQFE